MCVIIPVSHIPCTHTISHWNFCIDATRSSIGSQTLCSNVRQHDRPILTPKPCRDCGGDRFFARRGGVAERGHGSRPPTPEQSCQAVCDDTDDSGYQSDITRDEDDSDFDDLLLSPMTKAPPRLRAKQTDPSHMRKRTSSSKSQPFNGSPGWNPNLKYEHTFAYFLKTDRRGQSIDSMISNFDNYVISPSGRRRAPVEQEEDIAPTARRQGLTAHNLPIRKPHELRRRNSTLLHPSSPLPETTTSFQSIKTFSFPQLAEIKRRSTGEESSRTLTKKRSTLMHPSSPFLEPSFSEPAPFHDSALDTDDEKTVTIRPRKASTLLHPSRLSTPPKSLAEHKTIICVPPRSKDGDERTLSAVTHSFPAPPSMHQRQPTPTIRPPVVKAKSAPSSGGNHRSHGLPLLWRRRESILHSCLSDAEDE